MSCQHCNFLQKHGNKIHDSSNWSSIPLLQNHAFFMKFSLRFLCWNGLAKYATKNDTPGTSTCLLKLSQHAVLHRLQFCERVFYRHVGCKRWAHPTFPTMKTIYYLRVDKPPLYFQHFKIFITANVSVTNHLSMFQWLTIFNFFNFIFVLSHEKLTQRLCSASCSWFFF